MKFGSAKTLLRDRTAGIAMVTALSLPILIGTAGLAAETVQWTWARRAMQRQADSGAIAGAFALAQSRAVSSTVTADLDKNKPGLYAYTAVVENAPTVGNYAGNARAVRVVLTSSLSLPLISFFTGGAQNVTTEATAAVVGLGEYCAVALEKSATAAGITMGGSSDVNLSCGMISNAGAPVSVDTNGNGGTVTASPIAAVGGIPASSRYATGTELFPYAVAQQDPYGSLPNPVVTGTAKDGNVGRNNQSTEIESGVYSGFNPKGDVVLKPGVYVIDGGTFKVNSGTTVSGTGVTIVLTSRTVVTEPSSVASMAVNGGATINLTAPTTGDYAGVLIYQDRRASYASETINGGSGWKLEGAIYMPSREIKFNGSSAMDIKCIKLVALRLNFTGNTTVSNNCPTTVPKILGTKIKLVA